MSAPKWNSTSPLKLHEDMPVAVDGGSCSAAPLLSPGGVQLWRAELNHDEAHVGVLQSLLPESERQQAARFRFAAGRERFVLGRAMLRSVLAGHLGIAQSSIDLKTSEYGKPQLADESVGVHFNLSHSGELVLLALARGMEIGVDVEQLRPVKRRDQIARGILSEAQWRTYEAMNGDQRQQAFFRVWTRKEAIVKATGRGLSFPLADVEVTLTAGEARLLRFGNLPGDTLAGDTAPWHLRDVDCGAGYAAALAASLSPASIVRIGWRHLGDRQSH